MLSVTRNASKQVLPSRRSLATAAAAPRAFSPASQPDLEHTWRGTKTDGGNTTHLIGDSYSVGESTKWIDVNNPATQQLLSRVPEATTADMKRIVDKSEEAFDQWKDSSVLKRQAFMLKFQQLIRENHDELARCIVLEQGKTFADAKGDVLRGLQVVETACGAPSLLLGDHLEVSKDMDTQVRRLPLGVGAAVTPFNFPAMCTLWSIAQAIVTGNTLIVKPSERDPGATMILSELAEHAGLPNDQPARQPLPNSADLSSLPGLPKGVLSVMHGTVEPVRFICNEPRIKAITFVGGDKAGQYIYETGSKNGKRVQAQTGAKNHCILMPDANANFALNSIVGAAFGAAGQRCMALSTLVAVDESQAWVDGLIQRAKTLKVGSGFDPETEVGPVITPAAKERIEALIQSCEDQGGKILLDGRGVKVDGFPDGNWVGPTILEATTEMDCYQQEIFGPVLVVVKAANLNEGIKLINRNRYGNGASIFTQSGATARKFEKDVEAGQVGINVPIPVPLPMFSWSGGKASVIGGASLYGPRGLDFWTQLKTTTSLWRSQDAVDARATTAMPTMN